MTDSIKIALPGPAISSDALRNFRYFYFVRHWGRNVFLLVYNHSFLKGHSKNIREILEESGIPFSPKMCPFNDQEIKSLSGNPEDLGISLMNKICGTLWNKGVCHPGDRLKGLLKKIEDERNSICHEQHNVTEVELEHKVNAFRTLLEEILDEAKFIMLCDDLKIDQLKINIKNAVQLLLEKLWEKYDPSKQDELYKLQDEIKDFWDQLSEYILQLTQDELKSLYGRLCQIWPCDWLAQYGVTDPCGSLVSLKMAKNFCRWSDENQGCITVDQSEILDIKDPHAKDLAVIISGCAGAGKTTIMCSILEKWRKDFSDIPSLSSFQILLLMQFRNSCHDNFDEYLQSLLPQTLGLFDLKLVKSVIMSSKCLILCDGYDEANDGSEKLFQELITLNCKDMKIVVTTRYRNTGQVKVILHKAKYHVADLEIMGLQTDDMKSLVEKITDDLIKDDVTRKEEMKRGLLQVLDKMEERVMDILKLPLYFILFIVLYIDCPEVKERICSISTLFMQLNIRKFKKITEKTGIQSEPLNKFDELYMKYSLQNYKKEKYELSDMDINDMKSEIQCEEVIQNFDSLLSYYFTVKHSIEGLEMKKIYCYRHRIELEFAAAGQISRDIIKSYRTKAINIIAFILITNGVWEMSETGIDYLEMERLAYSNEDDQDCQEATMYIETVLNGFYRTHRERYIGLLMSIVAILYSLERNVLYSVIDDVYEFILQLGCGNRFDYLLQPYFETNLDPMVIERLALVLKSTSGKHKLVIKNPDSLSALTQLLPRLEPKCLEIRNRSFSSFSSFSSMKQQNIDFLSLRKVAAVANHHRIYVHLQLAMVLSELTQMSGSDTCSVDKLDLYILETKDFDLNRLCPFPVSSRKLSVKYCRSFNECVFVTNESSVVYGDIPMVSHVINAVWPKRQREDASGTENGGEKSVSPSNSKEENFEYEDPSLEIGIVLQKKEVKLLLESLTVQPLRKLHLPYCSIKNEEFKAELSSDCRKKGFGTLSVSELDIFSESDS